MPLGLVYPANTLSGAYSIDNSCRFDRAGTAYMNKTPGSAGNRKTFTISTWVKRGLLGATSPIFVAGSSSSVADTLFFDSADVLQIEGYNSGIDYKFATDAKYRDCSAWYHIVVAIDTTQGTNTDRMKVYVNGTQVTSFSSITYPDEDYQGSINNTVSQTVGSSTNAQRFGNTYFDGYMAETVLIDGSALAPTSFGEFSETSPTIWKPKDISGLTFGANGFYLDFEDSSNLGNDKNGGTDLTEANLAAVDQATDTPTNSFCTMNPLDNEFVDATFSEGNNQLVIASGTKAHATGTMGVSAGKWYWEIECDASDGDDQSVSLVDRVSKDGSTDTYSSSYPYNYVYQSQGRYVNNGSVTDTDPDSFTSGDIIGVALDLTNNKLYFAKNNTWQDSGDPTSGSTGTGAMSITAASGTLNGFYFPAVGSETTSRGATWKCNFGGCSAFTVSSAASDANGYGNFEYAPPSGYLALCTKNLGSDGG